MQTVEQNKALQLVSLARKGGKIEMGEEPVGAAARAGKARLILLASDASDHAVRRVKSYVSGTKQPYITVPFDKDTFGGAMGKPACAMAAITDVRLALAFVRALGENEKYQTLLTDLETRTQRVNQRAKEEKAHQKNIRHGKK